MTHLNHEVVLNSGAVSDSKHSLSSLEPQELVCEESPPEGGREGGREGGKEGEREREKLRVSWIKREKEGGREEWTEQEGV